jgi:hypothetical protein
MLMVGVEPYAIAGSETIPLVAKEDVATESALKPKRSKANFAFATFAASVAPPKVIPIPDLSPVVQDWILNILLTESKVTFIP